MLVMFFTPRERSGKNDEHAMALAIELFSPEEGRTACLDVSNEPFLMEALVQGGSGHR